MRTISRSPVSRFKPDNRLESLRRHIPTRSKVRQNGTMDREEFRDLLLSERRA
ncbi:MAG: hypothetical protein QOJ51_6676 [Acidobacteriaceae bacterium]|jgi:hypothetical protein|nr:hypothetical protein [Acidobacteriaceae bacterium]